VTRYIYIYIYIYIYTNLKIWNYYRNKKFENIIIIEKHEISIENIYKFNLAYISNNLKSVLIQTLWFSRSFGFGSIIRQTDFLLWFRVRRLVLYLAVLYLLLTIELGRRLCYEIYTTNSHLITLSVVKKKTSGIL